MSEKNWLRISVKCIRSLSICGVLSFAMIFSNLAKAQTPETTSTGKGGPKKQLATIIFAGLGGAVLGLSTLSFYGRPQDKLSNIAIGFAVGVIGGTIYVTYQAATNPAQFRGGLNEFLPPEMDQNPRWIAAQPRSPSWQLNWSF